MLAVDLAERCGQLSLAFLFVRSRGMLVDKIIEAGQLPEAVLPPELVKTGDAMFPIADDVERGKIDLLGRRLQTVNAQVLHEGGMVLQRELSQPLAPHAQRPVGKASIPHERRRFATERLDDG